MKMEMRGQLKLEQRMKLAPRMIQSMEILQLPILALQERIEQELNSNPVLEVEEPGQSEPTLQSPDEKVSSEPESAVDKMEDFTKLSSLDDNYSQYLSEAEYYPKRVSSEETDKKLEALKNTAAPEQFLNEYLMDQWRLIEDEEPVKDAGAMIIDYLNDRGYLTVRLEQLCNKDRNDFSIEHLHKALELVQQLEPNGVGARDIKECLLIQLKQSPDDMSFEIEMVTNHMTELLENRLPDIAKKMQCSIEKVNQAIERLSKLDTSPGLQVGPDMNHPIKADVIVELAENSDDYIVRLADSNLPNLRVSEYYSNIAKDPSVKGKTKQFLQRNILSAKWIIEAIEQRKKTLLNVSRSVVKYQKDYFDKGQLYLKPLPMTKVADDVGVHIATVSRAVAGKYILCKWGVIALRKFFSGGTQDDNGNSRSWQAIRGELQKIIDSENKAKPLSDDQIKQKLAQTGITNIARRTIAKYRKLMGIPPARMRKKY